MVPAPFTLDTPAAVAHLLAKNGDINSFVSTRVHDALREARAPRPGPLSGVPFSLKDEWETLCLPTTAGSHRHKDRRSPWDGPVFRAFAEAGAILLGKSNLSDMGLAPEASNWIVGPTRNPHDRRRTAGGSSGGAAAAVAAGMAAFDWGTDIGGSIRLPAAFCGVYGLKLSSACWPITDLFPRVPAALDWMCGQGPIASSLDELTTVLDVAEPSLRTRPAPAFEPRGLELYAPRHLGRWVRFVSELRPPLERLGLGPIGDGGRLPDTDQVQRVYSGVWASHLEELVEGDPSMNLARGLRASLSALVLRGRLGDRRFHPQCAELLTLIAIGRVTLFRDKRRALERAREVRAAFEAVWAEGRVIVAPVAVYPPPLIGRSNYNLHLLDCTAPGNLTDATGLAIPWGRFDDGLPRAIQLLGPPGSERALVALGAQLVAARASRGLLEG